ncbi:type I inositol polyphosphate 5-phosphatase 1 isoform X2 [Amborella trichopoda]|nr:type I inositol polyphosphate 5-phosphatase 1 isoform X2 [Amborella trichopoda]|eukprot:XP_020521443.1 type I inositol polyphosphate 5-phosphatase 1 isoform X2 [Amborella trichopoda]
MYFPLTDEISVDFGNLVLQYLQTKSVNLSPLKKKDCFFSVGFGQFPSNEMKQCSKKRGELSRPAYVLRKWLNIRTQEGDYSCDEGDGESDFEEEEEEGWKREGFDGNKNGSAFRCQSFATTPENPTYILRRRKSETLRVQYIDTKEIRICVGTWNVGGRLPPNDLDIDEWLLMEDPADIYVLGLQEVVPLNAGNVFGAEDNRPVLKWQYLIRKTLNRIFPVKTKFKCHSDPSSPSRFKPSDDVPVIEDDILSDSDDATDNQVHPISDIPEISKTDEFGFGKDSSFVDGNAGLGTSEEPNLKQASQVIRRLDRLYGFSMSDDPTESEAPPPSQPKLKLTKQLSGTERIGLVWPEPPMGLLAQHVLDKSSSFKSVRSFKTSNSFKPSLLGDPKGSSDINLISDINLEALISKKRSPFVRIVSKQMVGIFLTIWVRRNLRRHIHNLKVSTVGVGVMGYMGNKGSVAVSMSINQTPFCFICSHLTSGEKEGDEFRRNADVQEIIRRTQFHPVPGVGFPKTINDHERVIWFGDLNYRINLPYEKTRELISKKDWSALIERDQLRRELKKGRAFDGWSEGLINFPPTYKYEFNSPKYTGEFPKAGRRTPAWCDRILSFGKGIRQLKYKRHEIMLSDHRPVTAIFVAEVEVFSPRKLQKALTLTDAELEESDIIPEEIELGLDGFRFEDSSAWDR